MNVHLEEVGLARAYQAQKEFQVLSADQVHLIMERGRALFKWFKAHPRTHNLINGVVVASLLLFDGWVLLGLPRLLLGSEPPSTPRVLLASLMVGGIHGWMLYSMSVFSLHEGAAHNAIFVGERAFGAVGRFIGRNLCRLSTCEPEQYAVCHMAHHAKFGTEHDSEFLNFVLPYRYWPTFLPFATYINFSDFLAHRPLTYTRSRLISATIGLLYNGGYAFVMYRSFGALVAVVSVFLIAPHFAFYLDRLRQFTEHNLMPLDNRSGARSFGIGFWGLFVGGGPWGQPCHFVHHLFASIPWYQQIVLHRYLKQVLTPRQRTQFLIEPVVGFPKLLWRIVREANTFARAQGVRTDVRGLLYKEDRHHGEAVKG